MLDIVDSQSALAALQPKRRLVLVGCVKTKIRQAAPAKDLYDSALWRKRRHYAELTGMPWAILSAEHGMVLPDTVLEPYDRYLGKEPTSYRRLWSARTAQQVLDHLGDLDLRAAEIHTGAAYIENGLAQLLEAASVEVIWPFRGLTQGEHLKWYR